MRRQSVKCLGKCKVTQSGKADFKRCGAVSGELRHGGQRQDGGCDCNLSPGEAEAGRFP